MSAPKAERRALDAYDTPAPLARAICERVAGVLPDAPVNVLEPSAGAGVFMREAQAQWPRAFVGGFDIEPRANGIVRLDYLAIEPARPSKGWCLVLGNPPFILAEQFVTHSLAQVYDGGHVAFLLRASFLFDGIDRARGFWREQGACLRYIAGIAPRPSFTGNGRTDGAAYMLAIWRRGYRGLPQVLPHILWERA